jgi:hypothetical protein
MASSYDNDLRLEEIGTGDAAGSWGTKTNVNLNLIGDAFGYGTEGITTNANSHTTEIGDGAADAGRALYLVYTGSLDSTCTVTLAPDTVSKVWMAQNNTNHTLTFKQGSGGGASVSIEAGACKIIATDGLGSGAIVYDVLNTLEISGDLTLKTSDGAIINLQTSDTAVIADEVLGRIDFKAPNEAGGTDAILLAGSVAAISEGVFAADNNATKLSFQTATSGTAAETMQLSGAGHLDVTGDITGSTINADGDTSADDNAAMGYTAAEGLILTGQGSTNDVTIKNDADADVIEIPTGTTNVTVAGTLGTGGAITSGAGLVIADAGNIGSASDTDAISIASDGAIVMSGASVTASGTLGVTGETTLANHLNMGDNDIIKLGASADLQIYHDGSNSRITDSGTGSIIVATSEVQFQNVAGNEVIMGGLADGAVTLYFNNAPKLATVTGGVNVTGTLTATTNVTVSSDIRLKSNIETIDSALDKVKAMRGVYFDRHDDKATRAVGVIAQEMQEVMPEVVVTDDTEDKHLSVAYGNLVGVLIEAVKELSDKVEELEDR